MNIEDYGISVSFDEDFNRGEKKSTADIDSKQIGKFVLTLKDVEDGCGGIFVFCGLHIITWYVDQNKKNIVSYRIHIICLAFRSVILPN